MPGSSMAWGFSRGSTSLAYVHAGVDCRATLRHVKRFGRPCSAVSPTRSAISFRCCSKTVAVVVVAVGFRPVNARPEALLFWRQRPQLRGLTETVRGVAFPASVPVNRSPARKAFGAAAAAPPFRHPRREDVGC